jgi:hypothetical protein
MARLAVRSFVNVAAHCCTEGKHIPAAGAPDAERFA